MIGAGVVGDGVTPGGRVGEGVGGRVGVGVLVGVTIFFGLGVGVLDGKKKPIPASIILPPVFPPVTAFVEGGVEDKVCLLWAGWSVVGVGVGVPLTLFDSVDDTVITTPPPASPVGVRSSVGVGVSVIVGVSVGVSDGIGVRVGVGSGDTLICAAKSKEEGEMTKRNPSIKRTTIHIFFMSIPL